MYKTSLNFTNTSTIQIEYVQIDLLSCALLSCVWCKKCVGSFVCVYMEIISSGLFIDFMKIWLNEFLGLTVFGVRCSDCYIIISICMSFVGSGMLDVQMLNNVGDKTPLCGTPVLICFEF